MHGGLFRFFSLSGEMLWLDPFAQLVDRGVITVFFSCFQQLVKPAVPCLQIQSVVKDDIGVRRFLHVFRKWIVFMWVCSDRYNAV